MRGSISSEEASFVHKISSRLASLMGALEFDDTIGKIEALEFELEEQEDDDFVSSFARSTCTIQSVLHSTMSIRMAHEACAASSPSQSPANPILATNPITKATGIPTK